MEFNYPIDYTLYNTDEITSIIKFLDLVEECYLSGVELSEFKVVYKEFKSVVRAKSEENSLYRDFKEITGYDGYQAVKEMKNEKPKIKLWSLIFGFFIYFKESKMKFSVFSNNSSKIIFFKYIVSKVSFNNYFIFTHATSFFYKFFVSKIFIS